MQRAAFVKRGRRDAADGLSRARQEHIEDRQRAADFAFMQIDLHLLGDEEAEAQESRRASARHCERGCNGAAAEA